MTFGTCELSGESLLTTRDVVVVTPSGHVCLQRLLQTALTDNGGKDPFTGAPLDESDVVELAASNNKNNNINEKNSTPATAVVAVPPRAPHGTLGGVLTHLRDDYESLVLEVFSTRKVLQQTRQELSQALYQNDAAVRVVARLAAERDAARAALANGGGDTNGAATANGTTTTSAGTAEPASKKARLDNTAAASSTAPADSDVVVTRIPPDDLQGMLDVWKELQPTRKARQKAAAAHAVTQWTDMAPHSVEASKKPKGKAVASTKSFLARPSDERSTNDKDEQILVQLGSAQSQLHVYQRTELKTGKSRWTTTTVASALSAPGPTTLDVMGDHAVVGLANGTVDVVRVRGDDNSTEAVRSCVIALDKASSSSSSSSSSDSSSNTLCHVTWHPDKVHWIGSTAGGTVVVGTTKPTVGVVASFRTKESATAYTAGALHPDGLIYVAGTDDGACVLWDFQRQACAGRLESTETTTTSAACTAIHCSPNGYHIAVALASGHVVVWDLRKRSILATLNEANEEEESKDSPRPVSVTAVQFDAAGKHLAYAGAAADGTLAVRVTTVKQWGVTAAFGNAKLQAGTGVQWGPTWIAAAGVTKGKAAATPQLTVFGL